VSPVPRPPQETPSAPEPARPGITEQEPSLHPPGPITVQSQEDFKLLIRSLGKALGYVWLGCGILLLIAIPATLIWLDRYGRETATREDRHEHDKNRPSAT
ncbi:MAG: hypothetical protein J7M34_04815, partial [Anaerolineae bacterium]|nr:hypothetical protein [Anaerolineae bacterium]